MFAPNEDQALLAESVSKFVERHYADAARAAMATTPLNEPLWTEISELGWLMLPFSEDYGGLRGSGETGAGDMVVLFEALGPGLMVEPIAASAILAGSLIYDSPRAQMHQSEIAEIASGSMRAAPALHEARARHDLTYCETTAEKTGDGWVLNGAKTMALGAPSAHRIVVLARVEGSPGDGASGLGLFAVSADTPGVSITPYRLRDDHWAADVELHQASVPDDAMLAGPSEADRVLATALAKARLCLCAESVGLTQRALEATIAYVKDRRQFGQPIGTFQVVQHYLVEMSNALEQARSLLYGAAAAAEHRWTADAQRLVNRALEVSTRAGVKIAKGAIQLHGGMGVSEEMPLGRILRRQMAISLLFPVTR